MLQSPLFEEYDLREVAEQLDREERRLMGGEAMDHGNARMDGFFNVQVIKVLMERMGYSMNLIKGEAGKDALKDTAKEQAYICNRREHWFSLRGIGAEWFDLNSCLHTPQHYLAADIHHHINEAMREGYDVFVVRGDFPKTALENDAKALLEAVQGCGRSGQGHCLFAGQGQSMGGSSAPKTPEEMRAARLARLSGGAPAPAPAPQPAAAAAPPAPAPPPAAPKRSPELAQLMDMGFPEDKAKSALDAKGGNLEAAMDMLLSQA